MRKKAESLLEDVVVRLEEIFPFLSHEPSIRSCFLLGMLNIYLEEYRTAARYYTFLRQFNKGGKIKQGSSEYKTLSTCTKNLSDALQDRTEFSKSNLKNFQKPF